RWAGLQGLDKGSPRSIMSTYSMSICSMNTAPAPVSNSRTRQREETRRHLRTRQRGEARRQLVQAGLRVVAARGFSGATTAAIAEASGKAHGTVFVHFRTRDVLVAELVEEIGAALSQRLAQIPDEAPGIGEVLDALLAALAQHEVVYAPLLSEASTLPPA